MKQVYYIDTITDTVKLTTSPEDVKVAYKNIFIPNFKRAKEFLEYGYKSKYDLEWDLRDAPERGLKIAYNKQNELKELDNEFKKFIDEFSQYGHSLDDFVKSDEWQQRVHLNNMYLYYFGFYRFLEIDYKDLLWKNIYRKNHYDFIRVKTKYNRTKEETLKRQAQEIFDSLDKEVTEKKEEIELNQRAIGPKITEYKVEYSNLHHSTKLTPKRLNDLKDILIIYLSKKSILEQELKAAEIAISQYCNNSPLKGRVVTNKELSSNDIKWSDKTGYNIYQLKEDNIFQILYTWMAYNRLANITKEIDLCRNDDLIVIDDSSDGNIINIEGSFLDPDEYEITDNELALEAAMNPILTLFYKDKFNNE